MDLSAVNNTANSIITYMRHKSRVPKVIFRRTLRYGMSFRTSTTTFASSGPRSCMRTRHPYPNASGADQRFFHSRVPGIMKPTPLRIAMEFSPGSQRPRICRTVPVRQNNVHPSCKERVANTPRLLKPSDDTARISKHPTGAVGPTHGSTTSSMGTRQHIGTLLCVTSLDRVGLQMAQEYSNQRSRPQSTSSTTRQNFPLRSGERPKYLPRVPTASTGRR